MDDHPLVREWLANVINQQWDLTVCGESEGRENCLEAIEKKKPHVAVVDIALKDSSGFDLIAEIKQRVPHIEIIVLSMHSSPLYAKRVGNDNYHSFSGDSYFSRLFWVLSARFFGVFLGWFSAFAGAGFRPPGEAPKAGASVASGVSSVLNCCRCR